MEKLGMPAAAARAPLEGVFAQRPEKADERASLFSQRHLNKGVYLTMSTLSIKLKEEFIALLRVLMLKGTGIALSTSWQVTLSALILGKAVLVADLLPFINRYPDKPLIYNSGLTRAADLDPEGLYPWSSSSVSLKLGTNVSRK